MRFAELSEHWRAFMPALVQRWPAIEVDDLLDVDGDQDRLTSLLMERYGLGRDGAAAEIEVFLNGTMRADLVADQDHDHNRIKDAQPVLEPGKRAGDDEFAVGESSIATPASHRAP